MGERGSLRNRPTLLNVQAFYQLLATGIIIIAVMPIDKAASGKQGAEWAIQGL